MYDINGKVALITGGTGGIGSVFAKVLLQNSAKGVALLDINKNEDVLKGLLEEFGEGKVKFIQCDITDESSVKSKLKFIN